jgi:hypothetical protein
LNKLNDGLGGGFAPAGNPPGYFPNDWIGFSDVQDGTWGYVTIDLGQVRAVQWIRILAASEASSWIEYPAGYFVYFSNVPDPTGAQQYVVLPPWGATCPEPRGYRPQQQFVWRGSNCSPLGGFAWDTYNLSVLWTEGDFTNGGSSVVQGRYITIGVHHVGWAMLAEVEVYGY